MATSIALGLGYWQLGRAHDKKNLAAHIANQALQRPLQATDIANALSVTDQLLHRRITLKGCWLPQHTVFLDNRQMNQRTGFYVVTPFELSLPGHPTVLVQRGWVPRNTQQRDQLPPIDTPTGETTIEGRIVAKVSQAYALGDDTVGLIRQNLDLASFATEITTPLLPVVVLELNREQPTLQAQLLRDWPEIDYGVEKHYGYAVQWLLLAGLFISLYTWLMLIKPSITRKNQRSKQAPPPHS